MQRWMQSAAGGTSQRLNPAAAMMRSRSRMPIELPVPENVWPIAVMFFLPQNFVLLAKAC